MIESNKNIEKFKKHNLRNTKFKHANENIEKLYKHKN